MNIKNKKFVLAGLLALAVIIIIVAIFFKKSDTGNKADEGITGQEVSSDKPTDIVLDFYDLWLHATKATSTDPYQSELTSWPLLSTALRTRLTDTQGQEVNGLDPVLCQPTAPERVISKIVFELEDKAQILVVARDKTISVSNQAVVTLKRHNDGWYIDEITCSQGESVPEREFSFEKEGHLLKSVPPPLDPQYWYIVFDENGEQGHFAPLFFNAESTCLSTAGIESVCNPDEFKDATKVQMYGQMNELGVDVKKIEFLE